MKDMKTAAANLVNVLTAQLHANGWQTLTLECGCTVERKANGRTARILARLMGDRRFAVRACDSFCPSRTRHACQAAA